MKNIIAYLPLAIDVYSAKIQKKSETAKFRSILNLYSSLQKLFVILKMISQCFTAYYLLHIIIKLTIIMNY